MKTNVYVISDFEALRVATKDNQGDYACLFEPPTQTSDPTLMFDATELPNNTKAIIVDYLIKDLKSTA